MEIRTGDTVRFLSEKMEGVVTGVVNASMVNVYCEARGFEFPAAVDDLVVIRPGTPAAGPARELTGRPYLALVPKEGGRHEMFLVNDSPLALLYTVALAREGRHEGVAAGRLDAGKCLSTGSFSPRELDEIKEARVQAIFYREGEHVARPPVDATVKIHAASLCKGTAREKTPWFETPAVTFPLDGTPPVAPSLLLPGTGEEPHPREKDPVPAPRDRVTNNTLEVDLHADQLLDTLAGMEPRDILEHQLDVFRRTLEEFKLRRGLKIVFIHGKGDGVLKQRVRWELQTRYKRHHHQDASFKQYGYGATMVTIR
jgi:hypothetical protein